MEASSQSITTAREQFSKLGLVSADTELNFIGPGIVAAGDIASAVLAMKDPKVEAVRLDFLKPDPEVFAKIQEFLRPWLEACKSPGYKVWTTEAHGENGPEYLDAEFFKLETCEARTAFINFSKTLAQAYADLCDPARMKHNGASFPVWPEEIAAFKPDHLLTFVPHSHKAVAADWLPDNGFTASQWYMDTPILGAGMRVASVSEHYNSQQDAVLKALESMKERLSAPGALNEANVISELKAFWEKSGFDHTASSEIALGETVMLRYQKESFPGSVHWRMLSENGHMNGPQVASLNLMRSGGHRSAV